MAASVDLRAYKNEYVAVYHGKAMYPHPTVHGVFTALKKGGISGASIYWCGPGEPVRYARGANE